MIKQIMFNFLCINYTRCCDIYNICIIYCSTVRELFHLKRFVFLLQCVESFFFLKGADCK